jgi:hypothetical protein
VGHLLIGSLVAPKIVIILGKNAIFYYLMTLNATRAEFVTIKENIFVSQIANAPNPISSSESSRELRIVRAARGKGRVYILVNPSYYCNMLYPGKTKKNNVVGKLEKL